MLSVKIVPIVPIVLFVLLFQRVYIKYLSHGKTFKMIGQTGQKDRTGQSRIFILDKALIIIKKSLIIILFFFYNI
jgi:hypothetical protein